MKLSKTQVRKQMNTLLPASETNGDTITIWYQQRNVSEGNRSYIKLQDVDTDYIYYWLQRFLADYSQAQYIAPDDWNHFYTPNDACGPMGKQYQKICGEKYNSVNSLVAGLVSNRYRNPDVDFTKRHVKQIETLFDMICNVYKHYAVKYANKTDQDYPFRIGYTRDQVGNNDMPMKIRFKRA